MGNREERACKLHESGCNCCQSVLLAYADKLPISEDAAKALAAPFGRGISGLREVCGCVSAIAMVAGLTDRAYAAKALIEQFRQEHGDIVCRRLQQPGHKTCHERVASAARILDQEK